MEKMTQDVVLSQPESELKSPPSPKRPRTDCTFSDGHSRRGQFTEHLTFQEACVTLSLTNLMPKSSDGVYTAECVHDQKTEERPQNIHPTVILMNRLTPPYSVEGDTGSPNTYVIIPERSVLLVEDEQPRASETDKLSSYLSDDAGEALEESHTSKDDGADLSSRPDCDCLGKSLEDKPPGGSSAPAGNGRDGRQVQNGVSQIQAFNLSSSNDEEVRCPSDFTCVRTLCGTGSCHACSQGAGDEQCSQRSGEDGFSENILTDSLISSVDLTDSELFHLISEKDPCGSMAEGGKSEAKLTQMQLCKDEDSPVWDGKTKAQASESGTSRNPILSAAEWAEGSIVSYDMLLVRNIGSETVRLEADDFCGAKRAHAASKMIAKTESETADHTTETPMPARISQEAAEGDNDAGPFGVIDPAIWSESDREAVEKRCDSESAAGAELSTFVKSCEKDTPLCPDAQPLREDSASVHSRTHLGKDERDFCQSFTEPEACLTTTVKDTHNHAKCSPSSSCAKTPPGTNKTAESSDTMGRSSTEQDQSGCVPVSLDSLLAQEVEYLLSEFGRMDGATKIEERKETLNIESDEQEKTDCSIDLVEKLQGKENYREDASEMFIDEFLFEWAEEKVSDCGDTVASENNLDCLSDHPYSVVFSAVTPKESHGEEAEDIQGNDSSEVLLKLIDSELERDTAKVSPDEYTSEQSEALKSQSEDKLTINHQQDQSTETCLWSVCRPETADPLAPFALPSCSDAVVPGLLESRRSQAAAQNTATFTSSGRFSLFPSALPFYDCVSGAFDTFEKIELSQDNDGNNNVCLSNSPRCTGMPKQLLERPLRQLHPMPEAESSEEVPQERDEEAKEEDVERFECHTDDAANGLSSCDYSCDEIPNFISAADVPSHHEPEPKPDCESAFKSSESFQDELKPSPVTRDVPSKSDTSASAVSSQPQFEMRQQFDKVLKELKLFFDISKSEFACYSGESSPEQSGDETETRESKASSTKDLLLECDKDTSSDDADDVQLLDDCGCVPAVSCTPGRADGEQEVPLGSCQEVSTPTAVQLKEPQETEHKKETWSPAFMHQPLLEYPRYRPPEPNRRLEPLKTCTRPLRVGLSKRAKTTHLHHPHPYK